MPKPKLADIEAFVAVAQAGSFARAATQLALSSNAVSLRVRQLEDTLGTRLFIRTTRHVALTNEGETYLARIEPLLSEMQSLQEELAARSAGMQGTVRIAIPGGVAAQQLLSGFGELLAKEAALSVQIHVRNAQPNVAMDGFDIALFIGELPDSSFVGRSLGRVSWGLAAAPPYVAQHGLPVVPADLANHRCLRFLAYPPQAEWVLIGRNGREIAVPVSGNLEADDCRLLGDATYTGLGIGLRPSGELARAVKAGTLVHVLPEFTFRPLDVYAVLPKGRASVPRIGACLDVLRNVITAMA